jgi:dTDP-4-dehydrorhamnose reductase
MNQLQIWGGLECTLNRVEDKYFDQCRKNGHDTRMSDLELFHSLGFKKLRYPCLWEKVAPEEINRFDWKFLDVRLSKFKDLGQDIIAGLLHHGSGPKYTNLIDPQFPDKFTAYAREFAARYTWINDYTPINEINTTARFSLLYGHWYPHLCDLRHYYKSILLQCKATILSMREIKKINPKARLIQTDDLGKCQSTEELRYQCDYENERRWLSWDILSGMVCQNHPLYQELINNGIRPDEIEWFRENAYVPDVIGINHYHLSNRYLDHRLDLFPKFFHGGNGVHRYADVGAVDTGLVENVDFETLVTECWDRYRNTLAITECHLRGYRESQLIWLNHVWKTCQKVKSKGVDVEAVTAWSLLGTFDWHHLCTRSDGFYESGVFDLDNPQKTPAPTALTKLVSDLAKFGEDKGIVLSSPGTWETGRRIRFNSKVGQFSSLEHSSGSRPILIVGNGGTLGQALKRACGARNLHYQATSRWLLDIRKPDTIHKVIEKVNPWAIINASGYVRVDEAEEDRDKCYQINVEGVVNLAKACRKNGLRLVTYSSDLVFGNDERDYFLESHPISPINFYGETKAESERRVMKEYPETLIIRTSSFFGPWDHSNFITGVLRSLSHNIPILAPYDIYISPTYVPDLAHETLELMIDGLSGVIHLSNAGNVSWSEFASMAIKRASALTKINTDLLRPVSFKEMNFCAKRPRRSVLSSERRKRLPSLNDALERYFKEREILL